MMFLRVLELCLTLVALAVTWKQVLSPMLANKPLFPMFIKSGDKSSSQSDKKSH